MGQSRKFVFIFIHRQAAGSWPAREEELIVFQRPPVRARDHLLAREAAMTQPVSRRHESVPLSSWLSVVNRSSRAGQQCTARAVICVVRYESRDLSRAAGSRLPVASRDKTTTCCAGPAATSEELVVEFASLLAYQFGAGTGLPLAGFCVAQLPLLLGQPTGFCHTQRAQPDE